MKILYCIAGLFNSAGMERIITEKANYLAEHGHSVIIVTAEQQGREPYFSLNPNIKHIDLGINYSENTDFIRKSIYYPFKRKKHKQKLQNLLSEIRPDIAISTMGNEFLFLHKINDGSKKIAEIHFAKGYRTMNSHNLLWRIRDKYRSWQEEKKLKKYDKFVVLTLEDSHNWANFKNLEIIPNFITSPASPKHDKLYRRFICVGRLSYQKGYDRLIAACSLIKEELQGWRIDIFGAGDMYNSLITDINNAGLQTIIHINHPTPNIEEEYIISDALILPSRYEGFGMVLIEAMAHGIPAISFACPCGPRDIIDNGINGLLVEDGNIELLAQNIKRFIKGDIDIELMNRNARTKSLKFDKENIMGRWINLFQTLTMNPNKELE